MIALPYDLEGRSRGFYELMRFTLSNFLLKLYVDQSLKRERVTIL